MKVILINGSPHERGCTYTALSEVAGGLNDHGVGAEIIHIGTHDIAGCRGCFACRKLGKCVIDDGVNEIRWMITAIPYRFSAVSSETGIITQAALGLLILVLPVRIAVTSRL